MKNGEIMKTGYLSGTINPRVRSLLLIGSLLLLGLITGMIISTISSPYVLEQIENSPPEISDFELTEEIKSKIVNVYTVITTILCMDIALLLGLLYVYIQTYRKTKSRYLVGFSLFIGVILAKSITFLASSTPLISESIRFYPAYIHVMSGSRFGPFAIYFTIFEIIAMCILMYLSTE
jgi:hypothetical protein